MQTKQTEETTRILGRTVGREISAEEASMVAGGIQTVVGTYDKTTGKWKSTTMDESQ
ncbi:MAG TPA: hypothetical protein VIF60_24075 [Burkholderiaceae bacterium]|jgi:hypothetical protein